MASGLWPAKTERMLECLDAPPARRMAFTLNRIALGLFGEQDVGFCTCSAKNGRAAPGPNVDERSTDINPLVRLFPIGTEKFMQIISQ